MNAQISCCLMCFCWWVLSRRWLSGCNRQNHQLQTCLTKSIKQAISAVDVAAVVSPAVDQSGMTGYRTSTGGLPGGRSPPPELTEQNAGSRPKRNAAATYQVSTTHTRFLAGPGSHSQHPFQFPPTSRHVSDVPSVSSQRARSGRGTKPPRPTAR